MKTLQDFPAMKSQAVARQIHWDSLGGVFPTHMPPGASPDFLSRLRARGSAGRFP